VTLSRAAPAGGAMVTVSSANSAVLSVPASVMVPSGATTANFPATAGTVTSDQAVTIHASLNGSSMNSTVTVQTGLVAAYAFNEGSGSTTSDASGNGNTGLMQAGATWSTVAAHGKSLSLDGNSAYVDLGNSSASLKSTGSMTWSAWVYMAGQPPN